MKKIIITLLLATFSLFGGTINIAVAANVADAMEELKAEFQKSNPNTEVQVTLGSSGKLVAQIKNGAPFGIFLSADMESPHALYEEKIATTEPVVYAQGELAYLSAKTLDFSKGIALVADPAIEKIAIANPKTAPYGKAAVEAMTNAKVYDKAEAKLVYAESISQTVTYATTAADMGFVAKSSLFGANMKEYKEGVNWVSVDAKLYTPIKQGIVLLKQGADNSEYKAFYNFVLGKSGKEILKKYGYAV